MGPSNMNLLKLTQLIPLLDVSNWFRRKLENSEPKIFVANDKSGDEKKLDPKMRVEGLLVVRPLRNDRGNASRAVTDSPWAKTPNGNPPTTVTQMTGSIKLEWTEMLRLWQFRLLAQWRELEKLLKQHDTPIQ